jgi:hypothetical protein
MRRVLLVTTGELDASSRVFGYRVCAVSFNWVLNADETLASLGLSRVNTATLGMP